MPKFDPFPAGPAVGKITVFLHMANRLRQNSARLRHNSGHSERLGRMLTLNSTQVIFPKSVIEKLLYTEEWFSFVSVKLVVWGSWATYDQLSRQFSAISRNISARDVRHSRQAALNRLRALICRILTIRMPQGTQV